MQTVKLRRTGAERRPGGGPIAEPAPPRVLLAEDDDALRSLLARSLRGSGYEVIEARDGLELFEQVEAAVAFGGRHNPSVSLVVSDIRMPGLSGLEVLSILRCGFWAVPVILLTAFGDDVVRAEAEKLGAAAVLSKPFALDELTTLARSVLGSC